jgi:hypothetical protein
MLRTAACSSMTRPGPVQPVRMRSCFIPLRNEAKLEFCAEYPKERPELALDGAWRGSREQLRMPIACNRVRLKGGDKALNVYQHNNRCRCRDRRRRMHNDAKRAVVGVRVYLVNVRHLDHGNQHQQEQTHDCND